jgi:hypothetical protein
MVVSTHKELIFKESKKQHQILAQTAYYQAGKIVIQTILPEQPSVALITLNTLGTTCSTSADTYIPIENISNTQSCSFLESRLVSLYGGKAASLLIEYQQRLLLCLPRYPSPSNYFTPINALPPRSASNATQEADTSKMYQEASEFRYTSKLVNTASPSITSNPLLLTPEGSEASEPFNADSEAKLVKGSDASLPSGVRSRESVLPLTSLASLSALKGYRVRRSAASLVRRFSKSKGKAHLAKTYFAGAGNNIFQSTLGNREIQTATRLARIMVNSWNFYSLNKNSPYSLFKTYTSFSKIQQLNELKSLSINFANNSATLLRKPSDATLADTNALLAQRQTFLRSAMNVASCEALLVKDLRSRVALQEGFSYASKELKVKDKNKTPKGHTVEKNLYFAITQSKNSLKICENKNLSYNIRRLSVENIGDYSQLNTNNFQLIKGIQFSNLQRDRFYPNWFRLYLPDIEATEFLKNVANFYFSLGLQTFTLPSTKLDPFSIFLHKHTFKPTFSSYFTSKAKLRGFVTAAVSTAQRYANKSSDASLPSVSDLSPSGYEKLACSEATFISPLAKLNSVRRYASKERSFARSSASLVKTPHPEGVYVAKRWSKEGVGGSVQSSKNERGVSSATDPANAVLVKEESESKAPYLPAQLNFLDPSYSEAIRKEQRFARSSATLRGGTQSKKGVRLRYPFNAILFLASHGKLIKGLPSRETEELATDRKSVAEKQRSTCNNLVKVKVKNSSYTKISEVAKRKNLSRLRKPLYPSHYSEGPGALLLSKRLTSVALTGYSFATRFNADTNVLLAELRNQRQRGIASLLVRGQEQRSSAMLVRDRETSNASLIHQRLAKRYPFNATLVRSCASKEDQKFFKLNPSFSLLVENQIFPLNYNDFAIVEKELLYDALVNSCFAKAFYLINQNRQLLDFLVDYLLRFQILRQHQILYLFSTLLIGCNKNNITLANF